MEFNSFTTLALLGLFSLALLILPHQAFSSSRGFPLEQDGGGLGAAPPVGVCPAAVTVHGYKCQEFEVTTDDGYILSVQRIPEGRAGGCGPNRQPVLLQHGVLVVIIIVTAFPFVMTNMFKDRPQYR